MLQNRFLRVALQMIAVLVIIYLCTKISFVLDPLFSMFHILLVPFLIAGFFYYLLRPLVGYLQHRRVRPTVSILLIYFVLFGLACLFAAVVWPTLQTQIENLVGSAPQLIAGFKDQIEKLQQNGILSNFFSDQTQLSTKLSDYLDQGLRSVTGYFSRAVSVVTNFIIVMSTFPFILYYMLKEDRHVSKSVLNVIPRRYHRDGKEVLAEIDAALGGYIVGRVIITLLLGVLLFIGFLLIHLPYALLLAVISVFLNLIPYIGCILGAIPCLIVGFIESPSLALWVLLVILAAQLIESNLLAPFIYGNRLHIHPLTTVLLLLVAGDLTGIVGIIVAIPAYLILKIIVVRIYRLFFMDKVEELIE